MKQSTTHRWLLSAPPTLYLIALFIIPTLIMVVASFRIAGEYAGLEPLWTAQGTLNLTLGNYTKILGNSIYWALLGKSFIYASITALGCLMMAYPVAWTIAQSPKKWRNLLLLLVILPFWSNFLIRIYAWVLIFGAESGFNHALVYILAFFGRDPNTPVQLLNTPLAVLVGMIYVHLPFMVLPLYSNLEKHDHTLLEAAQDLGANKWQRFWRITFPQSLSGVYAGTALVFIPALGMFVIPEILGGVNSNLIGNEIKQLFLERRDWPSGSALSMLMMASLGLVFMLNKIIKRKKHHG